MPAHFLHRWVIAPGRWKPKESRMGIPSPTFVILLQFADKKQNEPQKSEEHVSVCDSPDTTSSGDVQWNGLFNKSPPENRKRTAAGANAANVFE
jgi:hypothetical protein